MSGGLFLDWPDWTVPASLPPLRPVMALDFETVDPHLKTLGPSWAFGEGETVGVALATDETSVYFPTGHEESNIGFAGPLKRWLAEWCAVPTNTLIMFNATYDLGWLRAEYGIKPACRVFDPMAAVALLDEGRWSYSLDACAKTYLKEAKVNLKSLADHLGLKDIWSKIKRVHPCLIADYAERDARLTYDLWDVLRHQLDREGLGKIMELEMALVPVLLDMRMRGVRVDVDAAQRESDRLEVELAEMTAEIKRHTGLSIDIWSAGSVEGALLESGITAPRTTAGAASVQAKWLETLDHPVPKLILKARRTHKIARTYMQNYILGHQRGGRIHAQFSPLRSDEGGAITGRFSCDSPNLQNLSARNPESASVVRGKFLPEDGELWGSADWSSQEPRLTVHFAELTRRVMRGRCRGADAIAAEYVANPRLDFHQWVADAAGISRKKAKDINLGLAYGMGETKLCASLGLPTEVNDAGREVAGTEARALLDGYHERLPFMRDLQKITTDRAEASGEIKTLLGRKRRFLRKGEHHTKGDRRAFAFKALNALIQGSAADQMKKAMVDCHAAGFTPLITLHDELCFSVVDADGMARIAEVMNGCVTLVVPSVVDIAVGRTWGEAA